MPFQDQINDGAVVKTGFVASVSTELDAGSAERFVRPRAGLVGWRAEAGRYGGRRVALLIATPRGRAIRFVNNGVPHSASYTQSAEMRKATNAVG
jgi:hypothetical protein